MTATTTMAVAVTGTEAGTDNNQLKAVTEMANGGGDGNSDDDGRRRQQHDNDGGRGVTHKVAGGDAPPLSWRRLHDDSDSGEDDSGGDCDCGGDNEGDSGR